MPEKCILESMPETREFAVPVEEAGTRLDIFLARRMPDWSRSQLQRLIRSGLVRVESLPVRKAGEEVQTGSHVVVTAEREMPRATPEDLPLSIVYEDDDLVVVDKPAGMAVHIGAGLKSGTLVNALLHHIGRLSSVGGEFRSGIVHRLDRMTSGLLVVAKNDLAHRVLASQFQKRLVHKTYTLLVHGRLEAESGEIRKAVGRDPRRRVRMKAGGLHPREALTRYRVLRRPNRFTLVEAEPQTGRTHQIRVHFSSIGHPVVGDTLYGAPTKVRIDVGEEKELGRTFLHASAIEFEHPRTQQRMRFTAPLPDELREFLSSLADVS